MCVELLAVRVFTTATLYKKPRAYESRFTGFWMDGLITLTPAPDSLAFIQQVLRWWCMWRRGFSRHKRWFYAVNTEAVGQSRAYNHAWLATFSGIFVSGLESISVWDVGSYGAKTSILPQEIQPLGTRLKRRLSRFCRMRCKCTTFLSVEYSAEKPSLRTFAWLVKDGVDRPLQRLWTWAPPHNRNKPPRPCPSRSTLRSNLHGRRQGWGWTPFPSGCQ